MPQNSSLWRIPQGCATNRNINMPRPKYSRALVLFMQVFTQLGLVSETSAAGRTRGDVFGILQCFAFKLCTSRGWGPGYRWHQPALCCEGAFGHPGDALSSWEQHGVREQLSPAHPGQWEISSDTAATEVGKEWLCVSREALAKRSLCFPPLQGWGIKAETSLASIWSPNSNLANFVRWCCKYRSWTAEEIGKNAWAAKQKVHSMTHKMAQRWVQAPWKWRF